MSSISRQSAGVPAGGQFAARPHQESSVDLGDAAAGVGVSDRSEMHEVFASDVREAYPGATHVEFDWAPHRRRPEVNWVMAGREVLASRFHAPYPNHPERFFASLDARVSEILDTEDFDKFEGDPWTIDVGPLPEAQP